MSEKISLDSSVLSYINQTVISVGYLPVLLCLLCLWHVLDCGL